MAALSESNRKALSECVNLVKTTLGQWDTPCDLISNCLDNEIGDKFSSEYGVGRAAHANLVSLIDILQEMEETIRTLMTDTNTYQEETTSADHL